MGGGARGRQRDGSACFSCPHLMNNPSLYCKFARFFISSGLVLAMSFFFTHEHGLVRTKRQETKNQIIHVHTCTYICNTQLRRDALCCVRASQALREQTTQPLPGMEVRVYHTCVYTYIAYGMYYILRSVKLLGTKTWYIHPGKQYNIQKCLVVNEQQPLLPPAISFCTDIVKQNSPRTPTTTTPTFLLFLHTHTHRTPPPKRGLRTWGPTWGRWSTSSATRRGP